MIEVGKHKVETISINKIVINKNQNQILTIFQMMSLPHFSASGTVLAIFETSNTINQWKK